MTWPGFFNICLGNKHHNVSGLSCKCLIEGICTTLPPKSNLLETIVEYRDRPSLEMPSNFMDITALLTSKRECYLVF